jgi:hypothetical protein
MERNVGNLDRTTRLAVGVVAALAGLLVLLDVVGGGPLVGGALLVVGVVALVTGLTRRCLAYRLLGVRT